MRRDVRILLVGDGQHVVVVATTSLIPSTPCSEGVGKSTIVTSLIKESFVARVPVFPMKSHLGSSKHLISQVQHVVPEVTIPPEVTPENVTTYIVDSGGAPVVIAHGCALTYSLLSWPSGSVAPRI